MSHKEEATASDWLIFAGILAAILLVGFTIGASVESHSDKQFVEHIKLISKVCPSGFGSIDGETLQCK